MSDQNQEPKEMHFRFERVLNGNSLFRWEFLALDENLHEEDPEEVVVGEFSFFQYVYFSIPI